MACYRHAKTLTAPATRPGDVPGAHPERETEMRVVIRLLHNAPIPGARWCEPIGWTPTNVIEGAEWADGCWWDVDNEVAGLVWVGSPDAYGIIEADLSTVRVARSGECQIIGPVTI